MDCVADRVSEIREENLSTVHLVSIGGWDAPHPVTTNSAEAVFATFDDWNKNVAARPDKGFHGFDGFDWDIEGNDDMSSPYNTFTPECLDLMGEVSMMGKLKGYVVSMVPAESYLDPTTSAFSRSLQFNYPEWESRQPKFLYHGRNCYAYLLAKYGVTPDGRDVFDFVTIQLYESYSHAGFNLTILQQSASTYLTSFVGAVDQGWEVDFSVDSTVNFPSTQVSVPHTRLVIGLANGWAGGEKTLLISPDDLSAAHSALVAAGLSPMGYAFWDIAAEGMVSAQLGNTSLWLASGINSFLGVRPVAPPCVYVVVSGDTLGAIATAHSTSVDQLVRLNPGINPDMLQVGQKLNVPC